MSDGSTAEPAATPISRWLSRLDRWLTGLGLHSTAARDWALAVVCAVVSVALLLPLLGPLTEELGVRLGPGEIAAVLGITVVQALVLSQRRLRPVACLVAVALLQLAFVAVLPEPTSVRGAVPLIAAYTAGTCLPPRRLRRAVAAAVGLEAVGGVLVALWVAPVVRAALFGIPAVFRPVTGLWVADWVIAAVSVVLIYAVAALVGVVVAARRERDRLLEARAEAAVRDQQVRARLAVQAERSRMARELHDVAAHHLSGLVVQAAAAERLVDSDPDAAKEAARSIRAQGREALTNLRAVVGILRDSGDGDRRLDGDEVGSSPGAPVPGLIEADRLFATARELGDDLDATITGRPYPLPSVADVAAYRILQESLANARQHAPGAPVRARIAYADEGLTVEVANGAPQPAQPEVHRGSGFGLVGMRERAELAGGELVTGPAPTGGWRVRLTLPRLEVTA